ncbi:leukemia inhibitory factor receptor-like isoform X2 [Denticeps clupeoides]|uniref:Fibronectin type-III domain-containing protein n=1 Tax=Denticeps clupeoides TaxID=299321 RepID=A0AAY4C0N2_9TELE|nr:leukemia inhibitory factor receptor-like isoform X2 [Denticeps clupeoides]
MVCWLLWAILFIAVEGQQSELPVPVDVKVESDSKNKIYISWKDDSTFGNITDKIIYEIKISYNGETKPVYYEEVIHPTVTHYWQWTSPLYLQCLTHSVEIRARYQNQTSKWIKKMIYGYTGPEANIYPQSETVLAGSKIKYCCIAEQSKKLHGLQYGGMLLNATHVINRTYIFDVHLTAPSMSWGDNLLCETKGTVVFVGYPPEVHNFMCETRNLKSMQCHWKNGRHCNLQGLKTTVYSLNARNYLTNCDCRECECTYCAIAIPTGHEVVDWTLTSKNSLNETKNVDAADPRHRVYLFPPHGLSVKDVDKRSANLHWRWNESSYESLPMVCQAQLNYSQAKEIRKESSGTKGLMSLTSLTLSDLYPAVTYSVRVRCHSAEHFWKWGDWSSSVIFTTKEDIPEALDIWMQIRNENTSFVVWKSLTPDKSHGKIQKYQVKWGTKLEVLNGADHRWYEHSGREGRITVSAVNSAGVSPPSSIVIPAVYSGQETTRLNASDGGFNLSWTGSPKATYGYVVDWVPAVSDGTSTVDWIKIPDNSTSIRIQPDHIKEGKKYILSLHACTTEAPELLDRWEGYFREKEPLKPVPSFKLEQNDNGVHLTWEEISQEGLRGYLSHYEIKYFQTKLNVQKEVNVSAGKQSFTIKHLEVASYIFKIRAVTGGGKGPEAESRISLMSDAFQIIVETVTALLITISVFICVLVLSYKNRVCLSRLKEKVYPAIPEPSLVFHPLKEADVQLFKLPPENIDFVTEDTEVKTLKCQDFHCSSLYQNLDGTEIVSALENPTYNPTFNCVPKENSQSETETPSYQAQLVPSITHCLLPSSPSHCQSYQPHHFITCTSKTDPCAG